MSRFITSTRLNLEQEPLYVVILAGALGYREKSKGCKLLQLYDNRPILEIQASTVRHVYPKAHITVTVGFDADKVIRLRPDNVSIIENQKWEELNTVEEIRLYLNSVNANRVLFVEGPVCFSNAALHITSKPSVLLYSDANDKEVGLRVEDGFVSHFSYGLEDKWSGLVYLEGKSLHLFKKICSRENSKLCMFEALNLLIDKDIQLAAVTTGKSNIVRL